MYSTLGISALMLHPKGRERPCMQRGSNLQLAPTAVVGEAAEPPMKLDCGRDSYARCDDGGVGGGDHIRWTGVCTGQGYVRNQLGCRPGGWRVLSGARRRHLRQIRAG